MGGGVRRMQLLAYNTIMIIINKCMPIYIFLSTECRPPREWLRFSFVKKLIIIYYVTNSHEFFRIEQNKERERERKMSKQITAWNHPYNCDRHQPDSLRCIHMNLTANCRPGYTVSNRMRNKNNNARHACRQLTPVWIITSIGNHTNTSHRAFTWSRWNGEGVTWVHHENLEISNAWISAGNSTFK